MDDDGSRDQKKEHREQNQNGSIEITADADGFWFRITHK
jgi:hypothetical protein